NRFLPRIRIHAIAVNHAGQGPSAAPDLLGVPRPALSRCRDGNHLDSRLIEALKKQSAIHEKGKLASLVTAQHVPPFLCWRAAVHEYGRTFAPAIDDLGQPLRMRYGAGEDERRPAIC